jgi:hypothetical protein
MVLRTSEVLAQLYEADETAWLETMAALIREGSTQELDFAHLEEYLTDMAKRDKREVRSRLVTLLAHLLKWSHQPTHRTGSWHATILGQVAELEDLLKSAVLSQHAAEILPDAYGKAVKRAAVETGLPMESFPSTCSFTLEQILTQDLPTN